MSVVLWSDVGLEGNSQGRVSRGWGRGGVSLSCWLLLCHILLLWNKDKAKALGTIAPQSKDICKLPKLPVFLRLSLSDYHGTALTL